MQCLQFFKGYNYKIYEKKKNLKRKSFSIFFLVGWAGFDDYELIPDQDNCKLRPPEAVPHEPETGDCYFQHSNCGWEIVQHGEEENNFQFVRTNANESVIQGPKYDHFGDPYGKFVIAYGELQSPEGTLAELRSPMFENVPSQCFHFHFTFKVDMFVFNKYHTSDSEKRFLKI